LAQISDEEEREEKRKYQEKLHKRLALVRTRLTRGPYNEVGRNIKYVYSRRRLTCELNSRRRLTCQVLLEYSTASLSYT
jgi:hypothetical protein